MRLALRSIVAVVLLTAAAGAAEVELFRIEGVRAFPDATVPGAIQYACAADQPSLAAYFAERGLPFEPDLVRKREGRKNCHIFYEPTLPGFRPSPDNHAITGLFASVDPISLVVDRDPIGDSLDIVKAVLPQLGRPVDLTISVIPMFEDALLPAAVKRHFGPLADRIRIVRSESHQTHPWAQDYVKSGEWKGEKRILVPHRLFEGREEDGEAYRPLLDAMSSPEFVRSKISWEGGDIQFAQDPRDPSRLVLFHGVAAFEYWGRDLTIPEHSWILRVEFGADAVVDLSGVGPHADYLVGFLPATGVALVARPVTNDLALAGEALEQIEALLGERAPARIRIMAQKLRSHVGALEAEAWLEEIAGARRDLALIDPVITEDLERRIAAHADQYCPQDPESCFEGPGRREFFQRDPALMREAVNVAAVGQRQQMLPQRLLSIAEMQIPGGVDPKTAKLNGKARELEKMGFRVVRAPILTPAELKNWPGVSYVNMLVFDRKIFVPVIGLPKSEERLLKKLQADVGKEYQVIPVPARNALAMNGGVHCAFGIVREGVPGVAESE